MHVPVVVDEDGLLFCGSLLAGTQQNGNDHEGEGRHKVGAEKTQTSSLRFHFLLLLILCRGTKLKA